MMIPLNITTSITVNDVADVDTIYEQRKAK